MTVTSGLIQCGSQSLPRLSRTFRPFLAVFAALVLSTLSALAQVSSGTLVGTVTDATGAVVPKVKVEARDVETGVIASATTTDVGDYRIGGLVGGTYTITASGAGFTNAPLQNVTVDANKNSTANLTLSVGS